MMFPQFVETIYSPALVHLAASFKVTQERALLTISIYFTAFALGVIFWGIVSDYIGRKKAMLYGIITYTLASILALFATNFQTILFARFVAAIGISVGSVITQTMMRDSYTGIKLAKVYSVMGIALSISPVIGLLTGGILANHYGYIGVFTTLTILGILLLFYSALFLRETKQDTTKISLKILTLTAKKIYNDFMIIKYAILVMSFNVLLFSYYSFAPFIFEEKGLNPTLYGYSGIFLAIGSFIGSTVNKKLLDKDFHPITLIKLSAIIALGCAFIMSIIGNHLLFLIPMLFIVSSFGIAIPNILSQALQQYKSSIGTASALFGLLYYLLISLGLYISSLLPSISYVMIVFSSIAIITVFNIPKRKSSL